MRIGTQFVGEIDNLGTESIQTKFFLLGLPLLPLESYYCLNSGFRSVQGFEIPMNRKSVLIAYLFWWLSVLPMVTGGMFFFISKETQYLGLLVLSIVIWFIVHSLAKLSQPERRRRTILKNIAGIGAPPEFLPRDLIRETLLKLEDQWQTKTSNPAQQNWRDAASSIHKLELDSLLLLFCLASYAKEADLAAAILQQIDPSIDA